MKTINISLLFLRNTFLAITILGSLTYCREQVDTESVNTIASDGDEVLEATRFLPNLVSKDSSAEFGISFTPDMKTLFFTSNRNENSLFHIYTSRFVNDSWQNATIAPFSGQYFDADAFVTLDGEALFFFSIRPLPNDTTTITIPNIWFVDWQNNNWSEPKFLKSNINQKSSGEGYMSITQNNTIYFSSVGRAEGRKHDIYQSSLLSEEEEVEFVDIDIETNFSNPYISPDEHFLIVDSKQEGGYGGNDLYISYKENKAWSLPENLGPKINTDKEEGTPSISPDGKWFFFSRNGDIYFISLAALDLKI